MSLHIWLRHETKPFEQRTPLTPDGANQLIQTGVKLTVERSPDRAFDDQDYASVGAELVEAGTWTVAPKDTLILGLKELPEDSFDLVHRHIFFAHCYKGQTGSADLLQRFKSGGGQILDLEFATDENGARIAAFGYWAGYVGAAIALLRHAFPDERIDNSPIKPFGSRQSLLEHLRYLLSEKKRPVTTMIIGARGRCGTGAMDLFTEAGVQHVLAWDMEQTAKGGPFIEINDVDIMVNAVYITQDIPPFVTLESLQSTDNRHLTMISDVSCDPNNANNPIRIYDRISTMDAPLIPIEGASPHLHVQAIDHLPSLLPMESSTEFADALLPHLLTLAQGELSLPWQNTLSWYTNALKKLT